MISAIGQIKREILKLEKDDPTIQGLLSGELTPAQQAVLAQQQEALAAQRKAVTTGSDAARRAISQTVREGAASRGLFSSDIALGAEASALSGFEQQQAAQLAGLEQANLGFLQGVSQQQQQGILAGLSAQQNRNQLRAQLAGQRVGFEQAGEQIDLSRLQGQQQLQGGLAGTLGQLIGSQQGGELLKIGTSILGAPFSFGASLFGF